MAVTYSQNGVIVRGVYSYHKTYEFGNYLVDSNGYIGEVLTPSSGKRTNVSIVDANADFSNSGLGQVTFIEYGTVEIQGIEHNTVKAGSLIWLAENLKVEFADIPLLTVNDFPSTKGMWWMNDDKQAALTKRRGALYNWYAAKYIDDNKSTLLPSGWRMPTYNDWQALGTAAGGGSIAGRVLKSSSQMWQYGWDGDDLLGFFVQESGSIRQSGQYRDLEANYWTISPIGSNYHNFYFNSDVDRLGTYPDPPERGYALRLVKDIT